MKETEDIFEPKNEKEEVFLHPNDPFVEKHPKSHFRLGFSSTPKIELTICAFTLTDAIAVSFHYTIVATSNTLLTLLIL